MSILTQAIRFDFVADNLEDKELYEIIGYSEECRDNMVIGYVVQTMEEGIPLQTFETDELDEAFKVMYQ